MLFKLMNCREEYLTGMQELLKGRGHKVIGAAGEGAEHGGDFIEIVIEGTEPGKNDPEICVSYSGAEPGKSPCALIRACGKTFVYRGFMTLIRLLEKNGTGEGFSHREPVYFDKNGTMLDCSRNSVLRVETIKKYIRLQAALGMNTMMLYTEDTYEVPEYPYFGAFRGRYTREELKECDDYADLFGIEMIPCIQTLAHLKTALRWCAMEELQDTDYILMVGDERVYAFIKACIKAAAEPFRSKRIHLGMDEAWHLGLGKYLLKNGYHTKAEIMAQHMEKVAQICRELQVEPMIWSDMYLRLNSPASEYYDVPLDADLSEAVKPPEGMGLVYWDYYHKEQDFYEGYLRMHRQLAEKVVFAGGGWTWNGLAPALKLAFENTDAAMRACKVQGVREAVCTMWQDDGAETPMAAGLPSILLFAEHGFSQEPDKEQLREQFAFLTGSSFDAYMLLGEFDAVPGGNGGDNPTKYLLYQDPMLGLFDGQISGMDVGAHYRGLGEKLKMLLKEKEYDAVIGMYIALAEALSLKADLGNRLCRAYRSGNREELLHIAGEEIPACRDKIAEYKTLRGKVWEQESRIFGFEVLDIRLGGLLSRMDSAGDRLQRYLDGELDRLPELEEARLLYRPVAEGETRTLCSCNQWQAIVTASTI